MQILRLEPLKDIKGNIFDAFEYDKRTSTINSPDGSIVFSMSDVEVPKNWSKTATDILAQKYLRKAGVPSSLKKMSEPGVPKWLQRQQPTKTTKLISETSAKQVIHRIVGCWTYWGWKSKYFSTEQDAKNYYDNMVWIMLSQMGAPNSPQWFNTGLHWAYGINGPAQGHYYVDFKTGKLMESGDAYTHPQPHACFIQSINDDLVNPGGIMDLWTKESRLFKYGSGTGTNFSNLRGRDEPLSGGGKSSGLMSFLKVGDANAGVIKSGGTTRRAAKMVILDVDHPDIEEFVKWKASEEHKVAALVAGSVVNSAHFEKLLQSAASGNEDDLGTAVREATTAGVSEPLIKRAIALGHMGLTSVKLDTYDLDWIGEAYQTVSGQNSNNSIRVTDSFMKAVESNGRWDLYWRTELKQAKKDGRAPIPCKTINAVDLWKLVTLSAWMCADPGIQFHDTYNIWNTCPKGGEIRATNPCSEYAFLDDTACNLASINLMKFYRKKKGTFDHVLFAEVCNMWTITLDISITMAQFPSDNMAVNSYEYRTLGLGYANLGTLLMTMGIPYDSKEALAICGTITSIMHMSALHTSSQMCKDESSYLGIFKRFAENRKKIELLVKTHKALIDNDPNEISHIRTMVPNLPIPIDKTYCDPDMYKFAKDLAATTLESVEKYGLRNAQVTVIAPTGTIGLLMDCDTTGIEPDYSLVKYKTLADGGIFKIINQSIPLALEKLGYTKQQITEISNYVTGHMTLKGAPHYDSLKDTFDKMEPFIESSNDIYTIMEKANVDRKSLAISEVIIDDINDFIYGTATMEGAPFLKEEHYPVFDCASKCGVKGKRYIKPDAHIRMMSACQAFISGSISKTINMPNEATVDDISRMYFMAWSMGVKAIAIYRDGSKLSQPLNSSIKSKYEVVPHIEEIRHEVRYVTGRRPLPQKRYGYTQKAKISGQTIYLRTGEYPDGTLGEIFLDMHREGAAFKSMLSCFAIAVSLGLQHGVPLEEFAEAFVFSKFEPSGMVTGHDKIKMVSSIVDYVFRELAIHYLKREELAHIKQKSTDEKSEPTDNLFKQENQVDKIPSPAQISGPKSGTTKQDSARSKGFTGDVCRSCGNVTMVRNGTCLKCTTCGDTTGCS